MSAEEGGYDDGAYYMDEGGYAQDQYYQGDGGGVPAQTYGYVPTMGGVDPNTQFIADTFGAANVAAGLAGNPMAGMAANYGAQVVGQQFGNVQGYVGASWKDLQVLMEVW